MFGFDIEKNDKIFSMKQTLYMLHADDFGYNDMVNRAVDECFMRDWVSETSLMVNMPECESAVALAKSHGYMHCVGIHVNLASGRPLTEMIRECPRFCSRDGEFNMGFRDSRLGRFVLSKRENVAVRLELEAQLRRFLDIGGRMMHVDSHHHIHTDWSIYRILKPLAIKYGYVFMRISADLHKVAMVKRAYKLVFNADVRKHFHTTDHFDGLCSRLLRGPGGTVEVMVHPLVCDGILCDTKRKFKDVVDMVRSAKDATIRSWKDD